MIRALMQYLTVEGPRQWLKYLSGLLAWLFPEQGSQIY